VIWDCDGVLVDSEALLKKGEVDALKKLGYSLSINDCTRLFSGVSVDRAMENFEKEIGASLPPAFFKEQIEGSLGLFERELQPLMLETVKSLYDAGVPMCVASGSPRERVLLSLRVGGMGHCFRESEVFTRELVAKGKPAPDLFLHSADKMGVRPERCIVVEDSVSGVEAALAAGMKCVSFLGGGHAAHSWYQEKILKLDDTDNVVHTFTADEVLSCILNM
jgi:HAD superfamily hydrolase (TIGR01509 family)